MKIAYLTPQYPKASHTFIRRELRELENRGHEIVRLSIRPPEGEIVDPADREELEVTHCCLEQPLLRPLAALARTLPRAPLALLGGLVSVLAMARRSHRGLLNHVAYLVEAAYLCEYLLEREVEHVHVHFGTNAVKVARLIRRLGGPPFSVMIHGPDEFDSTFGHGLREMIEESAFVVGISFYTTAQLRRWAEPGNWHKIHVLHCTVDEAFFAEASQVEGASNNFVCVGRLTPQKGQLLLLEALAKLVAEGREATLTLAGDGESRPQVEASIERLGLRERVTITGWIDEEAVRKALRGGRCLALPSFAEGLPVVIMEAFAMERPVISTYIAGIPELVRPGENGWLVPAGSVEGLCEAMREALDTPPERLQAMAKSGSERVRREHATVGQVDILEKLLVGGESR